MSKKGKREKTTNDGKKSLQNFILKLETKTNALVTRPDNELKIVTVSAFHINEKDYSMLFEAIFEVCKSKAVNYGYSFLKNRRSFRLFMQRNHGVLTLCFDENFEPLSFNVSTLCIDGKRRVGQLNAGLTVSVGKKGEKSVFELSNYNYLLYTLEQVDISYRIDITTLINDGNSLEKFHEVTRASCYPLPGNSISREKLKSYQISVQKAFELYVIPNFPKAKLCLNSFVVSSDKESIGFNDSYKTSKRGSDPKYSHFIRCTIEDYAKEDVLYIGELSRKLESFLKEKLAVKEAVTC